MLICIDCDGTLLRSDLSLSRYSYEVLKSLKEQGHHIILTSGRPPRTILPIYTQLDLDTPIVAYNGALIYSPKDEDFEVSKFLVPSSLVQTLSLKLDEESELAEAPYCTYLNNKDQFLKTYFPYSNRKLINGPIYQNLLEDVFIAVFSYKESDKEVIEKTLLEYPEIRYHLWKGKTYFELYHKDANKGNAIKAIQKYYDLTKEETIAFGDSSNDISMLLEASKAYKMKNHKNIDDSYGFKVTKFSNEDDGVARELNDLLLANL